jgi:sterol desaturase/sphingolipid hydroxylase (fatty acid hydroxylase superfamily)
MDNTIQYFLPIIANVVRYFLFAGVPFLIFYYLYPEKFSKNKIQARFAKRKDFIREIRHSMQTILIFAAVALLITKSPLRDYTMFYENVSDYSILWIPLSVLLALIVHDTYFYWMHRIVHHPTLFKHVHLEHHKSVNPSPWTSYSFDFIEGCLEAMIAPIILFLIPMHFLSLIIFTFLAFSINVYGHLGYEVIPKWFRSSFLFEIVNTSTHHNMHHEKFKENYGLYFRVWDRLMKTEHPDYVKRFDAIQNRRFGENPILKSNKTNLITILVIGFVSVLSFSFTKTHTTIEGQWKDADGAIIQIYEKGGLCFGKIIKFLSAEDEEKRVGRTPIVLKNFKKKNDTEFCCGTMYQIREKRTVSGTLTLLDKNTLLLKGTYRGFSGSKKWIKIK